jgi:ribosomal protein S14
MKYLKIKDSKIRKLFCKNEKLRLVNKFIFTNLLNKNMETFLEKTRLVIVKNVLNKKYSSKVKITRRCIFNNRGRGVLRSFGISRMYLRELMQCGLIPGYSKAVW